MCYYEQIILNKKYIANKKNGGNPPPLTDIRSKAVPIGCGYCKACRNQKARDWQVRMLEDVKVNRNGHFVTLTFSNENITHWYNKADRLKITGYRKDNYAATQAIRLFNEDWRYKYGKAPRHWMITELGHNGTENIHMHGIIWTDQKPQAIKDTWQQGFTWAGYNNTRTYVNAQTINYMMKYCNKIDYDHKEFIPKIHASPGIGSCYFNTPQAQRSAFNFEKTQDWYTTQNGYRIALPIYYRNKIYNDQEREWLWMNKLDKEIRWINGIEISIANNDYELYNKARKYAQQQNIIAGYGNKTNWELKEYEEQRRKYLQDKRAGKEQINTHQKINWLPKKATHIWDTEDWIPF